jgi:hypothetical protein
MLSNEMMALLLASINILSENIAILSVKELDP